MVRDGGSIRSRLLGGDWSVEERTVEHLEAHLEGTETVVYRLTSPDGFVREDDGETRETGGGESGTVLAVTDRRLVFVADTGTEHETVTIPYTDLKNIEEVGGLLRTKLAIRVWGRGTYRFKPEQSDTVEDVVRFASEAAETWQRTVAALQDAKQLAYELSQHVERGEMDAAASVREAARDNLRKARRQAEAAADPVGAALDERVATVERDVVRARMEARVERGGALAPEARDLADAGRFDAAHETLDRARAHVATALRIALDAEFPEADRIRSVRDTLDEQLDELAAQPLHRAEDALDRALATGTRTGAVLAWEHALACYRDALTAGWGTGAFDGDTDALRMQVEWLVDRVVDSRRALADRYESEGDTYSALEVHEVAQDRYESACAHLFAAERLARQYPACDAAALRAEVEWVAGKLRGDG